MKLTDHDGRQGMSRALPLRRRPDIAVPCECRDMIEHGALVAISSSGGKDSQAMSILLSRLVPREQLLVVHTPLGEVEWAGTVRHVENTIPERPVRTLAPRCDRREGSRRRPGQGISSLRGRGQGGVRRRTSAARTVSWTSWRRSSIRRTSNIGTWSAGTAGRSTRSASTRRGRVSAWRTWRGGGAARGPATGAGRGDRNDDRGARVGRADRRGRFRCGTAKRRRRDSGAARNLKKSAFGLMTGFEKTENPVKKC